MWEPKKTETGHRFRCIPERRQNVNKLSTLHYRIILSFLIIIAITIGTIGTILFLSERQSPSVIETNDIREHHYNKDFDGRSELSLFPTSAWRQTLDYYYYHKEESPEPSIQIYLDCTFNEESFAMESKRLDKLYASQDSYVNYVQFDSTHFCIPAYVAIAGCLDCYEYALLPGDNRIIYVYLQNIDKKDIYFDSSYLPSYYGVSGGGFSMYVLTKPSGEVFYTYAKDKGWVAPD